MSEVPLYPTLPCPTLPYPMTETAQGGDVRARYQGPWTFVPLNSRLKRLMGPSSKITKKKMRTHRLDRSGQTNGDQ